MPIRTAVVVTSISPPTPLLAALAQGCRAAGFRFLVVGDTKSPPDFALDGCEFLSIAAQNDSGFSCAKLCPTAHYARKNVGYLAAIRDGAELIVETDDDNLPRDSFFAPRERMQQVRVVSGAGWINAYGYFSDALIWPRGLPLTAVNAARTLYAALPSARVDCPIQQGLADANPDVDAIYRLLLPLPQDFRADRRIALGPGAWCPFNSQNTAWWPDAFALLYLPAYCSFRMTDIWRSFVAQRIAATNGWHILFHEPTVWQERNEHDLMRDFADEVPGYLHNEAIRAALEATTVKAGRGEIPDNMRRCYRALVDLGVIAAPELPLLDAWLADLADARGERAMTAQPLRLTLCLLTLNELEGCRHDVPNVPREAFDEVFAMDGGSRDGTVEYLEERGITVFGQEHKGYNGAYLDAFTRCTTDALVMYHPKGSIDPAVLRNFRDYFEQGFDLVVASRLIAGAVNEEDGKLLRPRKWFVRALGLAAALLWKRDKGMIADVLHGCRGMRRDAFFAIEPLRTGVTIDLEMVVRAYRQRLRRIEFPVVEAPRLVGETRFKAWPTGRAMLRYLAFEWGRPLPTSNQ